MRIAMFMPSLGPDALGWQVHRDFADAVERLGHSFAMLTTPRPGGGKRAERAAHTAESSAPRLTTEAMGKECP